MEQFEFGDFVININQSNVFHVLHMDRMLVLGKASPTEPGK